MAGSQQQQIIDTIFSMKRKLLRPDDSSDSEETDTPYNHRKQSLKRKAQYVRGGRPETSLDPPPFKKRIEHAGYHRYILQRNPARYDPDGDIVEPGDEYEDEDDLSTVEENPYADIRLENLLAPLTSAADLPTHPSYSIAYTSKHLTNLTNQAGSVSRKEQISLCRAKNLFSKFSGDLLYVPNGLSDIGSSRHHSSATMNGTFPLATNGTLRAPPLEVQAIPAVNMEIQDPSNTNGVVIHDLEQPNGAPLTQLEDGLAPTSNGTAIENGNTEPMTNGAAHTQNTTEPHQNGGAPPSPPGDDISDTASQLTAHRMTTRARAQAASTPSPPPSPSSIINPIHPIFTFSTDSLPHRDFGLPAAEAEDTRMLLMAFVSKQEEISKTATELYMGMMHGERMRQDVFKWSKAEAHVGEMSDGEDWYDREEWNLEEDLDKGKDEDEDETANTGKKSTRQRRKPDKEDR